MTIDLDKPASEMTVRDVYVALFAAAAALGEWARGEPAFGDQCHDKAMGKVAEIERRNESDED